MSRKRIVWIVGIGVAVACTGILVRRFAFPPLPFTGPYGGTVVDAGTAGPIAGATVSAAWTCHDNPLPDGSGHRHVSVAATTDAAGRFNLKPPRGRGGWFGNDFHVRVTAGGYIEAVLIHDPNNIPLPASTTAWPFADTSVHTSFPRQMTIALKPDRPVLLKAAESSDPQIRDEAEERLRSLPAGP